MIRLCILGNSHTAALKLASEGFCTANPDAELTFFAAVSRQTRAMQVDQLCYVPQTADLAAQFELTSGGLRLIDPTRFDAFLLYGFGGRTLREDKPTRYSRAFRAACVLARLREDLLCQHMQALRQLTDKPVFAALKPLPSLDDGAKPRRLLPHHDELTLAQRQLCDRFAVTLVAQPPQTLVEGLATASVYAEGSEPLERSGTQARPPHARHERKHMNAAYGRVWLDAFWPVLRTSLERTD